MLVFFIILVSIIILIYLSGIGIKIDNLEIDEKIEPKKLKICIYLLLFNKVKILKCSIKKEQIEKIKFHRILNRFKGKSIKQDRNIITKILKELEIKIEEIKINAELGLDDVIFLAYLVTALNIVFSIIYAKISTEEREKYNYVIKPYQTNRFRLKLSINCIITIKIANIINMFIKNRSEVKNERTSNRIFDGNSYEQYSRYGGRKYDYRSAN